MGGGPSRGTGPIHCEEVAELLGEHYYDEAWRVFEKVSSHRKDAHGQFIVPFHEAPQLARAFANDMLVRYGDDPQKLVRAASLFAELASPYATIVNDDVNQPDTQMAHEFLMMAEQLSSGFEQHSQNLKDRVAFLKRMAKEEEDYQIQMRWEADQERMEKEAKAKAKWDKEIKRKEKEEMRLASIQRRKDREAGIKSTRKKLPEPPETIEAAERLTQEAMAAVMRGDKCPDRADRKKEFEDAERRYGHALRLYEKLTGRDTMETAIALNRLGWHLKVRGKYSAADTLYRRSLSIREKQKGPRSMEVLVALSNLAENCRFLKKHDESDCIMARVAFLRTLHHVKPAAPDGASAKVQGPKVWQVFEDGAWKDVPADPVVEAPAPAPADELLGELLAATSTSS